MARTRNPVPGYRLHKQSGQGVVTLPDGPGRRRDVLLGEYNTPESRSRYLTTIAEWEAAGRRIPPPAPKAPDLTINELLELWWQHADRHYRRPDGTPTSEIKDYTQTLRPLRERYGALPAKDFSPLKLKTVREDMIAADLSRGVINERIARIVRVFSWAVGEELLHLAVEQALTKVDALQRGRCDARETEPIRPVSHAMVDETLPYMTEPVAALVKLQRLTGARSGELVIMRAVDIEMTGKIWIYRPSRHKTEHHGKTREIQLGPQAQMIVRPFLRTDLEAFLFSPKEALESHRAKLRRNRKTPVQPSQQNRRVKQRARSPRDRYDTISYAKAIANACKRAFPPPAHLARQKGETIGQWYSRLTDEQRHELKAWHRSHHWHPHQLRHTFATEVRKQFGIECASIALGHSGVAITEIYAEKNSALAMKVAAEIG